MSVPIGLALVWLASGIATVVLLVTQTRRLLKKPLTDLDTYCARADEALNRRDAYATFEDAEVAALDAIFDLDGYEGTR